MEAKQNREIQKDFVVPNPRPRPGPHGKNASVFNTPLQCRSGRYQCLIGLIEHICARAIFQVWHFLGEIAPSPWYSWITAKPKREPQFEWVKLLRTFGHFTLQQQFLVQRIQNGTFLGSLQSPLSNCDEFPTFFCCVLHIVDEIAVSSWFL